MRGIRIDPGKPAVTYLYVLARVSADGDVSVQTCNVVTSSDLLVAAGQQSEGIGDFHIAALDTGGAEIASAEVMLGVMACDRTDPHVNRIAAFLAIPAKSAPASVTIGSKGATRAALRVDHPSPACAFVSTPAAGANVSGEVALSWSSHSPDGSLVRHSLWYSRDGVEWFPILLDAAATETTIDVATLPASSAARLRLVAVSGAAATVVDSPSFVVSTPELSVRVFAPAPDSSVYAGQYFRASAIASGPLAGPVTGANYQWVSDREGELGQGADRNIVLLATGTHALSITALEGQSKAEASVPVAVTRRAASYIHVVSPSNTKGNSTCLSHPELDKNATAIVQVTSIWNPPGSKGIYNAHTIGVWFDGSNWFIFNEDQADILPGAAFVVDVLEPGPTAFTVVPGASQKAAATFSHPFSDGNQSALLLISHNWNPGGSAGVYSPAPLCSFYESSAGQWAAIAETQAPLPPQAAYNVEVLVPGEGAFLHTATEKSIADNSSYIDHPQLTKCATASMQVAQIWNPPGSTGVYNPHPIGMRYDSARGEWAVFNQDLKPLPAGASFAVVIN